MNKSNYTRKEMADAIYSLRPEIGRLNVNDVIDHVIDCMADALAEGRNIELRGLGSFTQKVWKARPARNPKNPSVTIMLPERVGVRFKPGKVLAAKLAAKKTQ